MLLASYFVELVEVVPSISEVCQDFVEGVVVIHLKIH